MSRKLKKTVKYSINRAVLSDTLPYETPLTFSNRHFYKFLNANNIKLLTEGNDQSIQFNGDDDAVFHVIKLLFQLPDSPRFKELRFNSNSGIQHLIDELIAVNGWTCFNFTVGEKSVLKITNKSAFRTLINFDDLKKEREIIINSRVRNHTAGRSSLQVLKVLEKLIFYHCKISLNLKTRTISCQLKHAAAACFINSYILKENSLKFKDQRRLPFHYRITHKDSDYRELSIPHPKNQLEVVAFYDEFKELILYYSDQSSFSIRRPFSIASYIYINDDLHSKVKGDNADLVEQNGREYESLKTFFTYKKYPNIHKFYEDYKYHRAEKKYNFMFKFDISKCFDSIYTHSIVWALYEKSLIKDNLSISKNTFPGKFDTLMQNVNFGETNGILIGPEFSRIFSELILQRIDKDIENQMFVEHSLRFKADYEVYRYVDDYFIFYNEETTKDTILNAFKIALKTYKMSLSEEKSKGYKKPLITELTIAKNKIINLFESEIKFCVKAKDEEPLFKELDIRCNSNALITKFKIIIKESQVEYKDIMNFTLALLNKRFEKCIEDFDEYYIALARKEHKHGIEAEIHDFSITDLTKKLKQETKFTHHLIELLDFTFFIYTVNPRVNFTIKLCRILSKLISTFSQDIKFFIGSYTDEVKKTGRKYSKPKAKYLLSNKDLIFKKISDEIRLVLENNKVKAYAQIESLYLLVALQQLGNGYRISQDLLFKYFNIIKDPDARFQYEPSYFVITVLLFYIRNAKPYKDLVSVIQESILARITKEGGVKSRSAECTLLVFDMLVCPYVDAKFKRLMLNKYDVADPIVQEQLINFKQRQKYWFTKWDKFNFLEEIEAKIAHEPY